MKEKKIIEEFQNQQKIRFSNNDEFSRYIVKTLENFSYRYIETQSTKQLFKGESSPLCFEISFVEMQILEALKIENPVAKKGIIELAKSFSKKEGPEVRYFLKVEIKELNLQKHSGVLITQGEVFWDYPNFQDSSKKHLLKDKIEFEDLASFRKKLPLSLEKICEVF